MHMIFRHIIWFLKKFSATPVALNEKTSIEMRVLPTDLDFLWHVNNGVYFSYLDFGRMNMIFRNGIFDLCRRENWYSVVASETIKFRKSLQLWDKFKLETEVVGHDEKYFFISQRIMRKDVVVSQALIKIRFLSKKGGGVSPKTVLEKIGTPFQNQTPQLGQLWAEIESKYLA